MNHISRLHCRIQVAGSSETAFQLGARMEADVRRHLTQVYGAMLDRAFEGDPCVYVIRRMDLHADLTVHGQDDTRAISGLARQMAVAVRQRSLQDEEVIRFENQADYLAHFTMAVLAGQAWDSWLYGPFQKWKARPFHETLGGALLEDPGLLVETLVRIRVLGGLEKLLGSLPAATQQEIWEQVRGSSRRTELGDIAPIDAWQPFHAAASRLLSRMGMWKGEPPALESVLSRPDARHLPAGIDWRDRRSLSAALLAMLHLLSHQGFIRAPQEDVGGASQGTSLLDEALRTLDWLDQDHLKKGLLNWFEELRAPQTGTTRAPRPAVPTPRQITCLKDLLDAVQAQKLQLNRRQPEAAENALRLLAALGEQAARWRNDPLAAHLIATLLAAWESLSHATRPAQVLEALRQGNLAEALKHLPHDLQAQGRDRFRELLAWGASAAGVLAVIDRAVPPHESEAMAVPTRCAGVALLMRAMMDARLPQLLEQSGFLLPAVLLHCFEVWAGQQARRKDQDPGLLILAGGQPDSVIDPVDPFPASASFQKMWADHLDGLRMSSRGDLAGDLLRLWARWLRGFAGSSQSHLLDHFIRRPGALRVSPSELRVEMETRPLDVVLDVAGYLNPIENVPWLGGRRVTFALLPPGISAGESGEE